MDIDTLNIPINKIEKSRINEVDFSDIKFGREFSDHMFVVDYIDGEWKNPVICPYQKLSISPAMSAIHYGQSIFEGLKAYKNSKGETFIFRADANIDRMNRSAQRMCMPSIPKELFKQALFELIKLDNAWVPQTEGSTLYIRPFMFATDEYVGIKPSSTYKFIIFTCPVGSYYSEPLRVKIERKYTRAADGGVGEAKAAGNYAASLYPAKQAQDKGYHQLIWTDGIEHKYIEESGTMNVFFQIEDKLITPALSGNILPGITRDSIIKLAKSWGVTVEERKITVAEVINAAREGKLVDAFGAGTAATIAQIKTISDDEDTFELPNIEEREMSNRLYKELNLIKLGELEDKFGWVEKL